jgi:hypothetical protein
VSAEVGRWEEKRDVLVPGLGDEHHLRLRLDRQYQLGAHEHAVHRAPGLRAENVVGKLAALRFRARSDAMVGRVVDDGAALEAHDHPPRSERGRRQLDGIHVEQLDVLTGSRGIPDLDNRDRGLFASDAPLPQLRLHLLRNSDRPLG